MITLNNTSLGHVLGGDGSHPDDAVVLLGVVTVTVRNIPHVPSPSTAQGGGLEPALPSSLEIDGIGFRTIALFVKSKMKVE